MLFKQKIFAILISLALIFLVIDLVRRKKIREEYSWLWMLTAASVLILCVWYDLLLFISQLIGAVLPTTTLFIFAILFLVLIALHFSIKISDLTNKVIKLTQEMALLKNERNEACPPA
jgi:hypothetical protein